MIDAQRGAGEAAGLSGPTPLLAVKQSDKLGQITFNTKTRNKIP